MEVNGEEERRRSIREDEGKEEEEDYYYYSLLNSPCSACHKFVQAILKCLGLDSSFIPPSSSSSSSPSLVEEEEDPRTDETVDKTGFMARIIGVLRRRPRPPYSSGPPGQNN